MEVQTVTLPLAFLAGLLSFASPCVLPLVPAYIGYLGGSALMADEPAVDTRREVARTFVHSLFFVLGFSTVFVLLGASATLVGRILFDYSGLLQRAGGLLLVIFGMRLMAADWSRRRWVAAAAVVSLVALLFNTGLLRGGPLEISTGAVGATALDQAAAAMLGQETIVWLEESIILGLVVLAGAQWSTARLVILAGTVGILNFLASFDNLIPKLITSVVMALLTFFLYRSDLFYAEKRLSLGEESQAGYLRSLLFGLVFAAGWTPCIGPILAMILVVASQLQTVGQGVLLLISYSLGLGIPFIVLALAFGPVAKWLRRANRYLPVLSGLSGALLVLMGILIFTDSLSFLARYGNLIGVEL
jgi:cytochrome c-type biogenesis protein